MQKEIISSTAIWSICGTQAVETWVGLRTRVSVLNLLECEEQTIDQASEYARLCYEIVEKA